MSSLQLAAKHAASLDEYSDALCSLTAAEELYVKYAAERRELNTKYWLRLQQLPSEQVAALEAAMSKEQHHSELRAFDSIRVVD